MSVRDSYVQRFGETQADALVAAAEEHGNGINNQNLGSDPFKWAALIAIGYQCVELYGESHGITVPFAEFQDWAKTEADLGTHDGDCDYLAVFSGAYAEYVA